MRRTTTVLASVLLLVPMVASTALAGRIIYVDADAKGTGTGTSWTNAYTFLQDGLAAAFNGDEIRVAQGVYKPDRGGGKTPGDRRAGFNLVNGVTLKAGYAGFGEPNPDARDVKRYKTPLSGDLKGDDTGDTDDPSRNENSFCVVYAEGVLKTTTLDGFTITAGNINSPDVGGGGGMYSRDGSPTLIDCKFSGNRTNYCGGGLHCQGGSPTFTRCTFEGNWSGDRGCGAYLSSCNATLVDCVFANNRGQNAGGMMNDWASPTLTNCTFSGNAVKGSGGGMRNDHSSPKLINCIFSHNSSGSTGAGMYGWYSNPILTNCRFDNNQAGSHGGGLLNQGGGATLTNCTFTQNSSECGGGINHGSGGSGGNLTVVNCTFIANVSASYGGGIEVISGSSAIANCTFTGNTAGHGGALSNVFGDFSDTTITNCVLWGDTPTEIWGTMKPAVYSDVQGGTGESWFGRGSLDVNPLFADPNGRLAPGSPCIDAGSNAAVPPEIKTDLDGYPRVRGTAVDMGAYETGPAPAALLDQAVGLVRGFAAASFTNPDSRSKLIDELEATIALLHAETYQDALNKLLNDILPRIDGCAKTGQRDSTDWIIPCEAQVQVHGPVSEAIELVRFLVTKPVDPIAQPIACWTFDETSGAIAKDTSGQRNNGTVVGPPKRVPGQIGGALEFDGSTTYVKGPHIPLNNRSFTIAMWVKPVLTGSAVVLSEQESNSLNLSLHLRLGGPNSTDGPQRGIRMGFYSNDLDSPANLLQDNTWYHVAFWYSLENQRRRIYVNGVQVADAAATPFLATSGNVVIGSWNGEIQFYRGLIDDVRIYDQALTEREIVLHCELGLAGQSYPLPALPAYRLMVSSTPGGSVTKPGEGVFSYTEGDTVPLEAAAKAGYHFTRWSGTAVDAGKVAKPDASVTSVIVDANCAVVANFAANAMVEDFEKGKLGAGWSSSGNSLWYVTSEERHAGKCSARAGSISDDETTSLTLRTNVTEGRISFWRKVSSQPMDDVYSFSIDGDVQEDLSGEQGWKEVSFPVSAGTHTFVWEYKKDSDSSLGADTVYLDDVSIPAAP